MLEYDFVTVDVSVFTYNECVCNSDNGGESIENLLGLVEEVM